MGKEVKGQAKVGVAVEKLWKALAVEPSSVLPRAVPNLIKSVEVLEGDGGLDTIMIFHFGPDLPPSMAYQKEKIVEYNEAERQIGLEVIEGGRLVHGFNSYTTFFKLAGIGDGETLVDITVQYEKEGGEEVEEAALPSKTIESTLLFLKYLEEYILKKSGD
ncbi:phytohormone-binding protein CSBP-like [Aristolochia californica]|uniref:phytohormone-binding protein CSBP-like n=1 Tax=Aristolochia californica TaxID=171875 RepID=UPI0035D89C93